MAVGKKKRFEVFKRDGFTCQYCGGKPPKAVLECDHVEPVSTGGGDEMDNLITSCFDCNRGKSNSDLEVAPASVAAKAEMLKEQREQLKAYKSLKDEIAADLDRDVEDISIDFAQIHGFTCGDCDSSIRTFLERGLSKSEIVAAMGKAISVKGIPAGSNMYPLARLTSYHPAMRYFFGICWRKIREGA